MPRFKQCILRMIHNGFFNQITQYFLQKVRSHTFFKLYLFIWFNFFFFFNPNEFLKPYGQALFSNLAKYTWATIPLV
jgi:hypothetical protein